MKTAISGSSQTGFKARLRQCVCGGVPERERERERERMREKGREREREKSCLVRAAVPGILRAHFET
jgi:hypothetical protein